MLDGFEGEPFDKDIEGELLVSHSVHSSYKTWKCEV